MKCNNCGHCDFWHIHEPGSDNDVLICSYFKCDCGYFEPLIERVYPYMRYKGYASKLESFVGDIE
jgi:hypothetical protein